MNRKKKKVLHNNLKKWTIYISYLIISLNFFFKELTKYKHDY